MQVPLATFFGIDVSKAKLDLAEAGRGDAMRTIANSASAIDSWLATLPAAAAVAVESTGRYHQLLVQRACALGVTVYVLNAKDVYFYAKAIGTRAKTDRLDAHVIARYLAERHQQLHPFVLPRESVQQIDQLLRQRALLVDKRTAVRLALQDCPIEQPLEQLEEGFSKALDLLDEQLERLIASDAAVHEDRKLLHTVIGLGKQSSALLASLLNRVQFTSADALVAYCGLDPRANDSGAKRGRRTLSKRGSPHLRRAMYLAAFGAARSKALNPVYQALRQRGFATTEAFVILARKLLRVAYAVWTSRRPFDISKLGAPVRP
jgi:transposase